MVVSDRKSKTIFVAVACIGDDTELERTVESCIKNASFPDRVNVGVNLVYGKTIAKDYNYIYRIEQFLSAFHNVRYAVNHIQRPLSIARDRNNAASLYENEDYVLQIDSHCFFTRGWDEQLIESLEQAIEMVNNQKTVLTATLPKYNLDENGVIDTVIPENVPFGYGFWQDSFLRIETPDKNRIPAWAHTTPDWYSWRLAKRVQESGFAPAIKVTGSFIFGNKNFASNMKLPEHIIFWEEEIIHSIELIGDGFTLVYPYILANIYHYYQIDQTNTGRGKRSGIGDMIIASAEEHLGAPAREPDVETLLTSDEIEEYAVEWRKMVNESFSSYLDNPLNQDKIRRFEKYSGISFKTALAASEFPMYYSNIGAFPIDGGHDDRQRSDHGRGSS
jgi:hypothetical protein